MSHLYQGYHKLFDKNLLIPKPNVRQEFKKNQEKCKKINGTIKQEEEEKEEGGHCHPTGAEQQQRRRRGKSFLHRSEIIQFLLLLNS